MSFVNSQEGHSDHCKLVRGEGQKCSENALRLERVALMSFLESAKEIAEDSQLLAAERKPVEEEEVCPVF